MSDIKALTKKLNAANKALVRAQKDQHACAKALENAVATEPGIVLATTATKDLGELVADAARSHGGECADYGKPYTSASWKLFRSRLKELSLRAVNFERDLVAANMDIQRLHAEIVNMRTRLCAELAWATDGTPNVFATQRALDALILKLRIAEEQLGSLHD